MLGCAVNLCLRQSEENSAVEESNFTCGLPKLSAVIYDTRIAPRDAIQQSHQ